MTAALTLTFSRFAGEGTRLSARDPAVFVRPHLRARNAAGGSQRTLIQDLSLFEATEIRSTKRTTGVPSTAKRERVRVRVCDSVYPPFGGRVIRRDCFPPSDVLSHVFSKTEPQALTLTLSRFAVEGTPAEQLPDRVPSTAKRERVG